MGSGTVTRRCLAAALALVAAPAWAHGAIPGIGAFYSGALHPFVSPAHLIVLLALGLRFGQTAQQHTRQAKHATLALLLALVAGLCLHTWAGDPDTDRILLACAALAGLAVATARAMPAAVDVALGLIVGAAVGLSSGPSGVEGRTYVMMLLGTGLASIGLTAYVTVMVSIIQRAWLRVAVRVLGSWLAAAALLVLALGLAATQPATGG